MLRKLATFAFQIRFQIIMSSTWGKYLGNTPITQMNLEKEQKKNNEKMTSVKTYMEAIHNSGPVVTIICVKVSILFATDRITLLRVRL